MADKHNYSHTLDTDKDNIVTVKVEVSAETYLQYREATYKALSKDVNIAGFRKGKAPRAKVEARLGSDLHAETIRELLPNIAAEIVDSEELNPVSQLEYDLQKYSENEGVSFTFSFTNYPEVKIPDITKLKVEVPEQTPTTEQEIDDVMGRLYQNEMQEQSENKDKSDKEQKLDLSKVTDEMVAKWDIDGAKTVKELREQISQRLDDIKHQQYHRVLESKILEELVDKSTFSIPKTLLDQQTKDLVAQHFARIDELNISREDFLAAQGTSEAEINKQKAEEAERRVSVDLVLNQVAKDHNLIPSAEEVDAQIDMIEDATTKTRMDTFNGRRYILTTLLQANALEKLANSVQVKQVKPKSETKPKTDKKPAKK